MSARAKVWSIGLPITLGLAVWLALDEEHRGASLFSAFLGLILCTAIASLVPREGRSAPTTDPSPADGVVDLASMLGVEGVPNPELPRIHRFVRLIEEPGGRLSTRTLAKTRPTLRGRVVLVSLYLGRDGSGWSDREIARGHEALEQAGVWIEREAIRRAVPVNIELSRTYFQSQDDVDEDVEVAFAAEGNDAGPMEANASTKAIIALSRAAAALGFADAVDLIGRINQRVVADACVWLIHVRRSGRSLAVPVEDSDLTGVGLALCYSREASFPEPLRGRARVDPTTVAHELLHLFGATDKYGVDLRSFPRGWVGSTDIMRLNFDELSRMKIGRLTAREVGWREVESHDPVDEKARRIPH